MPLSAAAVRRRGDQIRRRRHALVAGGAALAVAALTVPVLALTGGDVKSERDHVAPDPGPSLSTADLITDDDTQYTPGTADWFTTETFEGDGQAAFHPCARSSLTGIGADAVYQRNFELRNLEDEEVEVRGDNLNESIAEFESPEAAREAYDTVARWILGCEGRIAGADEVRVFPKARTVEVPTGGDAVVYDLQWGPPAPELDDPIAEEAYISETGIVLVDNRIAVLTLVIVGQDYTFLAEDGGTPMERMIPPAGARLLPGDRTAAPEESETPDRSDPAASNLLGDGRDLIQGMATNESGAPVLAEPNAEGVGEIDFCGTSLNVGPDAVERLAANASGPEYAEAREVVVLPSADAADALAASIADAARACATQDVGGTTWRHEVTTREDQPLRTAVVTRTYEVGGEPQLGTTTWVVAHDGPLVLVATSTSEGSAEPTALDESTEEYLSRLRVTMEWLLGLSES